MYEKKEKFRPNVTLQLTVKAAISVKNKQDTHHMTPAVFGLHSGALVAFTAPRSSLHRKIITDTPFTGPDEDHMDCSLHACGEGYTKNLAVTRKFCSKVMFKLKCSLQHW